MGNPKDRRATTEGTCQVCFSLQRLPKGEMALHGYRRPGGGFIEGRCPGVGYLPYEQDCSQTKRWEGIMAERVQEQEKSLAGLETHPPGVFDYEPYYDSWSKSPALPPLPIMKNKPLAPEVMAKYGLKAVPSPSDPFLYLAPRGMFISYQTLLERRKRDLEQSIKMNKSVQKEFHDYVVSWVLKPVKEVEPLEKKLARIKKEHEEFYWPKAYAVTKTEKRPLYNPDGSYKGEERLVIPYRYELQGFDKHGRGMYKLINPAPFYTGQRERLSLSEKELPKEIRKKNVKVLDVPSRPEEAEKLKVLTTIPEKFQWPEKIKVEGKTLTRDHKYYKGSEGNAVYRLPGQDWPVSIRRDKRTGELRTAGKEPVTIV